MKKKIKYLVFVILALIIVDRCTLVHITSSPIFKKREFKTYPFLSDGVTSDNYEIKNINNVVNSDISYDTLNNYFLVNEGREIKRISAKGLIENTLEVFPHDLYFTIQSHYVLGTTRDSVIYDLSKSNIQEKFITKIITITPQNPLENWTSLYNKADVVFYRRKFKGNRDSYPIYLRIDGKWLVLMYSDDDYYTIKETFPEKYKRLVFLKDYKNKRYSINGEESFMQLNRGEDNIVVENTFNASEKGIKNVFFSKENTYERFNPFGFIEFMPTMFVGTGYFQLEKDQDVLKFKNKMLLHALSQKKYSELYHFSIPERFKKNSEVSFILFKPYSNYSDYEGGISIVKRKEFL